MRSCIAYANRANIIVNKDSPFGSGAEVSRICYTCLEFLTFGFVRITWGRHYTAVCYLNMNTSTKTIIPKKRKGKQITWKVCPNSIAVDVCSWRFNQPFTSLWMNSRFTCKRTCRGTRPNADCHRMVLREDSFWHRGKGNSEIAYWIPSLFQQKRMHTYRLWFSVSE